LRNRFSAALSLLLAVTQLAGCASLGARRAQDPAVHPQTALPEAARLDVGVLRFDPGLPPAGEELPERVFPAIREAESVYFACQLRESLLETGAWGDVRVVPQESDISELLIQGTIVESDGEELLLDVVATDASGRTWLDERYLTEVGSAGYPTGGADPYQPMFYSLANDLAALQNQRDAMELAKLRELSALRYGSEFLPDKFGGYLEEQDGELRAIRLPAEDDPIYQQVQQARAYEAMFVGTLDSHYQNFCDEMVNSYTDWRRAARDELALRQQLRRARNVRIALIPVVVAGVVMIAMTSGSDAGDLMAVMLGGIVINELIRSAKEKHADAAMHESMLSELDNSFRSEVQPMVVQTEETTVRLTGNVNEQYQQWRRLLEELYRQTESVGEITVAVEEPEMREEDSDAAAAELAAP
jgi:hypothetical protein